MNRVSFYVHLYSFGEGCKTQRSILEVKEVTRKKNVRLIYSNREHLDRDVRRHGKGTQILPGQ